MKTREEIIKYCSKPLLVTITDQIQINLLMDIRDLLISIDNNSI